MSTRKIPLASPSIEFSDWEALQAPLKSGWLTQGEQVELFEAEFANFVGTKHAVATSSCTTALHMMLIASGVGPGDEVIVPAFTWVATANAVVYTGATPIFADVSRRSFNASLDSILEKVTQRTRAVVPVHQFGLCFDVAQLRSVLDPEIIILEDAACAIGASIHGDKAGTLGRAAAFSLHPRKIITTGEGGMITTNDSELAARLKILRSHGVEISDVTRHTSATGFQLAPIGNLGFNYRLSDIQAALGRSQLSRINTLLQTRRDFAKRYTAGLAAVGWLTPPETSGNTSHAWQSYVCTLNNDSAPRSRDQVMERLAAAGISTRPGTYSLPSTAYYQSAFNLDSREFPNSAWCEQNSLALPLHTNLSHADVDSVIGHLINL